MLSGLCGRGKALLLPTHVLEIAGRLCDRVAILEHGRLAVAGNMAELREQARTLAPLEEIFLAITGALEGTDLVACLGESTLH